MKRVWICILFSVVLSGAVSGLDVSARSAILMDGTTGEVLFEKNADERSLIASTTKIMTALVTLEHGNLSDEVMIPQAAVGIEGSSMYLKHGEILTVEELLHGLMLVSGNDAAVALAIHVGGSVEDFAELMNEKAEALGLNHSHFSNPNGLDSDDHYGTARDLGVLAAAAMENPEFRRIVSTKSYQCSGHTMSNHNKLLWQYDGAVGVKTGFTKHAGRILVGSAERNGRRLISVTIQAPSDWEDHATMLDYGFGLYQEKSVLQGEEALGVVPVISGTEESVPVKNTEEFRFFMLSGEHIEVTLHLPEFLYAPVPAGEKLGTAELYLGNHKLTEIPLMSAKEIPQVEEKQKRHWMRAS